LANIRRPETQPGSPADEAPRDCPQEEQPERTNSQMGEIRLEAPTHILPSDAPRPTSSSGQREDILPRRQALAMFCYQSFLS
jgi:hypothetical protein